MKLSKKILAAFSAAALLAMAGTFVACTEDDDDTEGAITGSGKNYAINYTNESDSVYRCTNTTTLTHLGELVKITINDQANNSVDGAMGFIWDLQQSKDAASVTEDSTETKPVVTEKGHQNFFVATFRNKNGNIQWYVSKYFNVTDLQAKNFGAESNTVTTHKAGITSDKTAELTIVKGDDEGYKSLNGAEIKDGVVTLWLDVYPLFEGSKYGTPYAETAYSGTEYGSYVVDVYGEDPRVNDSASKLGTTTIRTDVTGYSAKPKEQTLAVYANVASGHTLNGAWNLAKDYAADEVVED